MNQGPMRTPLALASLLALALAPSPALARPRKHLPDGNGPRGKAHPPCGAKILPLVEGNSWTYESIPAPPATTPDEDQQRKTIERLSPPEPKTVTITVKSVNEGKRGEDTVITLEEKTSLTVGEGKHEKPDERTIETTITCNAKDKFEISPDSFFFAGEPGGYYGLKIDSLDRSKDPSLKLTKGGIGDRPWREDLVMHWTRVPTPGSNAQLGSGKLELERSYTPEQPEMITTKLGTYRSEKLALVTTGRVTLDHPKWADMKPMELPAAWLDTIWMAHDVGVVQVLNRFSHMYQLTAATLK